eukprot:13724090-Ditylum_brightwellii.AAC.1
MNKKNTNVILLIPVKVQSWSGHLGLIIEDIGKILKGLLNRVTFPHCWNIGGTRDFKQEKMSATALSTWTHAPVE